MINYYLITVFLILLTGYLVWYFTKKINTEPVIHEPVREDIGLKWLSNWNTPNEQHTSLFLESSDDYWRIEMPVGGNNISISFNRQKKRDIDDLVVINGQPIALHEKSDHRLYIKNKAGRLFARKEIAKGEPLIVDDVTYSPADILPLLDEAAKQWKEALERTDELIAEEERIEFLRSKAI